MKTRRIMHLKDLARHKKLIIDSCTKFAIYFLQNDNEELALEIMRRAFVHDISKTFTDEFQALDAFKGSFKCAALKEAAFTKEEKFFLEKHWSRNKHHPEYWRDVREMTDIDIIEMVCDWHARSVEFNTDLIEYIENRQIKRFSFPEDIYQKIIKYAYILT